MRMILGILIGGAVGFGWYKTVGCTTGSCPITSDPWLSTFYGAFIGFLVSHP